MRCVYTILWAILLLSCTPEKGNKIKPQENKKSTAKVESASVADSTFMDFFETFMWDKEFQKSRIILPIKQENKDIVNTKDWKHLSFYTESQYIPILNSDTTTLFDKNIKESTIGLFIINIAKKSAIKYSFIKSKNKWFLSSTQNLSAKNAPDSEFIDFLTTFSNDSIYQINHIMFPLPESYADSESDYETVNKDILKNEWRHIKAVDNKDKLLVLSNIEVKNKYRNVFYRGVENGIMVKFTFEKISGTWKLIKFEDYST